MSIGANTIAANALKHYRELALSQQLFRVGAGQNVMCKLIGGNNSSLSILVGPHRSGKTIQMPSIISKPSANNATCKSLVSHLNILSAQAAAEFITSATANFAKGKLIGLVDVM
ncbi:uncharacterized protein RAG0_14076 [Rhynchosporium agropyri]|uniref:Uncharacterized protein n=1 Tax=Rhynchosporium agropyri TaxID=914238 RepID=A0A1E1LHQ5_9HELO|nr:uncharacterized protein RAG0_14076 [Rhynchosporium agropyri]